MRIDPDLRQMFVRGSSIRRTSRRMIFIFDPAGGKCKNPTFCVWDFCLPSGAMRVRDYSPSCCLRHSSISASLFFISASLPRPSGW